MVTMTINISDKTAKDFRETVKDFNGVGKGKLGSAIDEALNLWISKKRQEKIIERQIARMEKGYKMGKWKFNREELHER